jgi:hypothetical protein
MSYPERLSEIIRLLSEARYKIDGLAIDMERETNELSIKGLISPNYVENRSDNIGDLYDASGQIDNSIILLTKIKNGPI